MAPATTSDARVPITATVTARPLTRLPRSRMAQPPAQLTSARPRQRTRAVGTSPGVRPVGTGKLMSLLSGPVSKDSPRLPARRCEPAKKPVARMSGGPVARAAALVARAAAAAARGGLIHFPAR